MTTQNAPLIGQEIDGYRVEALLGHGGMAQVYRGIDIQLDRLIALKVILPEERQNAAYEDRFKKEARAVATLRHPGIVGIFRFGHIEDIYYMAMEYIDGPDLNWILRDYRKRDSAIPHSDILQIVTQIARALDHAHAKGVIHRDIKPSNIMIDSAGNAILTDFGLALVTSEGTLGSAFGSPHYIAPEQAISSAHVVPQSDLYALGIIVYEMLTGTVPFRNGNAMQIAMAHMSETPPSLQDVNPDVHPAFIPIMAKALSKKPDDRYPSGAKFVTALRAAIREANGAKITSSASNRAEEQLIKRIHAYMAENAQKATIEEAATQLSRKKPERKASTSSGKGKRIALIMLLILFLSGFGVWAQFTGFNPFSAIDSDMGISQTLSFAIEGPVSSVSAEKITVFDISIHFANGIPPNVSQITPGDTIRLEGNHSIAENGDIVLQVVTALTILPNNNSTQKSP